MRNVVKRLRRKLGDKAANPTYIFTEPRVGYRMAEGAGEASGEEEGAGAIASKPGLIRGIE